MKTLRTNTLTILASLKKKPCLKVALMLLAALLALPLPTSAQTAPSYSIQGIIGTLEQTFGDDNEFSISGVSNNSRASFSFNLPERKLGGYAILIFKTKGIDHANNIFMFNGQALKVGPSPIGGQGYTTHHFFISHIYVKETGNVFRIYSRNTSGGATGNLDDFVVFDAFIIYETTRN